MLTTLLMSFALAADPVAATTASGFSWNSLRDAKAPISVASFTYQKISYDLKCTQAACEIDHGTTRLAAHVTVSASTAAVNLSTLQPTINVVIDGTDAGYIFQSVSVRWLSPTLPKGTVLKLGGDEVG